MWDLAMELDAQKQPDGICEHCGMPVYNWEYDWDYEQGYWLEGEGIWLHEGECLRQFAKEHWRPNR